AAEQARRAQRTAYLQDRLGPTGQTPRNAGRPSKHAEGRFTLTGIQPGRYVLDVSCPQHVSTVFGPIEVAAGQNATDVTILVRRGAVIAGSVEDKVTRKPLQGVVVSLLLPDLDTGTQAAPTPAANLFNVFRREFNRVRVARVRTDAQGRFELPPQRPGDYWLELEHDGYNALLDRAVFVRDGRRIDLPAYALVPGSEVSGRVLHGVPGTQYTVTYWSTEGQRFTARTDENHEYRIEGIEPGSYYVVLSDGSGEPGFGRRGRGGPGGFGGFGALGVRVAEFLGGNTTPDVVVAEGAKVRFDIDARAQTPATVRGKVLVNGSPAAGYEVALDARTEGGANGTPGLGRFARAVMNGRTDEQGQFTISNVVPGSYTLEVRRAGGGPGGGPGGRGRGGGPGVVLHREPIVVAQGATIERTLTFATGALTLAVTNEADGKPVERGNVVLALRSEATGVAPDQWRTLPSFTMTPIRNGTATFRELKLGDWLYRVQSQGLAPVEGGVFVGGGTGEGATLKVALKPPAPAGTDGK
ncbi:MAG TPA: carboxypeptidase regulatory-like domain-containing protein, partial [Planctomycetota bacterium]|nr:carboxypeptidase regulatory-like domain-containing protein [Planctomycetota bacterium]